VWFLFAVVMLLHIGIIVMMMGINLSQCHIQNNIVVYPSQVNR